MSRPRTAARVGGPRKASPPASAPPRAVGYLRVSTAGQAERGMSLAAQRDRVGDYASAKGYRLIDVVEEAASGAVRDGEEFSWEHRPALLKLLDRALAGEFEVLVVAKLDRLSRDFATLTVLERRLQRCGVEVLSVAEENGDGPIAEFIRGQLALVAQLERAMILERVTSGKAKKKALGRHVHGRVPYGYRSEGGVLEPIVEMGHVVRRIFRDTKDGYSPGRIGRALNRDGIPSPEDATWSPKAVSRIVTNPAYVGERYGVKNAHPAIVSRRLFNAAGAALRQRADEWAAMRGTH
jgi:site-specific DNA recombinase